MEEDGSNSNPYKLLDLIPNEKEWTLKSDDVIRRRRHGCSDDKKLELRLGLPGNEENWSNVRKLKDRDGLISLGGYFPCVTHGSSSNNNQAYSVPPPAPQPCYPAVSNSSQKRAAPAPVVGWPPIRNFRKNIANSNAPKSVPDPQSAAASTKANEKATKNHNKGLFVKINMDGVPIGRKVDLSAYDSYEKLSSAIDGLFGVLLAAQNDSSARGIENKREKAIVGLLDGSGEYTLVYEDNEGDRMLVGDVPWPMFVSTVKRLRVLKSSELSMLQKFEGRVRNLPNE